MLTLPALATVADALAALADHPDLGDLLEDLPVVLAVNREYAPGSQILAAGDEVALIPPVSGGAPSDEAVSGVDVSVRVSASPVDAAALIEQVGDPGAGATVVFLGTTRDVTRLDYDAYAEMAYERIAEILRACAAQHGLRGAAAAHRTGSVALGEASIGVAVSARHRDGAFAGARAAIDRIKAEAPIWKREVESEDGRVVERWVEGTLPSPAAASGGQDPEPALTHIDEHGSARMVDVGAKPATERRARARAAVRMAPATVGAVLAGDGPKGDVIGTARLAGIQAAKRTSELIPLAHPVPVSWVDVEASIDTVAASIAIEAEARTVAGTGVELEALTAAAVAALTVYDMVKGLERGVTIEQVCLLEKSGGRSGHWRRGGT